MLRVVTRDMVFKVGDTVSHRATRRNLIMAFDKRNGVMFELNDTASDVFRLIDGRRSVGQIVSEICAEYDADESVVFEDVVYIVNRFGEAGILGEN